MSIDSETYEKLGIIGTMTLLGGGAVRWLLRDRSTLIAALGQAHERERAMSEQRTGELLDQAKVLAESSEIIRSALRDVTDALEALERKVEECSHE